MATWPLALPQKFPLETRRVVVQSNVVRTAMDVGPAKVRRRALTDVIGYDLNPDRFVLRRDQLEALDYFYDTVLGNGTLPFDWLDPWRNAGTLTFRFRERPTAIAITAGNHYLSRVTVRLEQV